MDGLVGALQKAEVEKFSSTIRKLRNEIRFCRICHDISDQEICEICSSPKRDHATICVVEDTRDVMAIQNTDQYNCSSDSHYNCSESLIKSSRLWRNWWSRWCSQLIQWSHEITSSLQCWAAKINDCSFWHCNCCCCELASFSCWSTASIHESSDSCVEKSSSSCL